MHAHVHKHRCTSTAQTMLQIYIFVLMLLPNGTFIPLGYIPRSDTAGLKAIDIFFKTLIDVARVLPAKVISLLISPKHKSVGTHFPHPPESISNISSSSI